MKTFLMSEIGIPKWKAAFSRPRGSTSPRRMALFLACVVGLLLTSSATAVAQGICDRTPQVRDKLVEIIGVSECGEVTSEHLAAVTRLDLTQSGIGTLRAGDFDGLTSLEWLYLGQNPLTSLPAEVFSGLSSLRRLALNQIQLTSLPAEVFNGLSSLDILWLHDNQLSSLPEDIFSGLTSLRQLGLSGNQLTSLPAEVFSGLSSLYNITLGGNQLTSLPAEVFNGLTSLKQLFLWRNQLTSLPADVFSGLSSLDILWLRDNQLSSLPEDIFSGLTAMKQLWLDDNQLTSLPADVFSGLSSLIILFLDGNPLTSLPEGVFDDVLDTLGGPFTLSSGTHYGVLSLDSGLKTVLTFASTAQTASAGDAVTIAATLSRPLPVAVRVPYAVGGSATTDDYTDLSPSPSDGLLFPAGETRAEITLTLSEGANSVGRTLAVTLGESSEIKFRRSDGTGPDAPHLKTESLLLRPEEGATHTVTLADPSDFTSADLAGQRMTLDATRMDGTREDIRLIFREGNRFEETRSARQSTAAARTGARTAEAAATTSRFGSYDYQRTGPQMGRLRLDYDDGVSCAIEITFTATTSGMSSYGCSGGSSGSGSFQLRVGDIFVPVILTSAGRNNSYFTSEMTLTNRGSREARLHYTYTAHIGGGSGTASEVLPPGRQRIVRDAVGHLKGLGIPIPEAGSRIGTLRVEVSGSSRVGVMVRTTTAVPEGRAGLAYPGVVEDEGFEEAVYLCGLRQNEQDRSNVAFQNMGTEEEGPITLRATVYSGDAADMRARVLEEVRLGPGGFHQYSGVLGVLGSAANGYVKVERVEGEAPFYAYGVINDQANSDGSFVFPVTESSLAGTVGQTLPVIVERAGFASELTVTNFSGKDRTVILSLVADAIRTEDDTASFPLELQAGQQHIIPNVVAVGREQGVPGIGPPSGLAGPLFATAAGEDMSGIVIGARTGSEGENGQYSVFYNAVPFGESFREAAWVDGLQQNEENRSNLALVNTGEVNDSPSTFEIDIYDGETGLLVETVTERRVAARRWHQIDGILGDYAPGTRQGYVRIRKVSGDNPFLAYGVVNDGGAPGERSGDGSYLPARE